MVILASPDACPFHPRPCPDVAQARTAYMHSSHQNTEGARKGQAHHTLSRPALAAEAALQKGPSAQQRQELAIVVDAISLTGEQPPMATGGGQQLEEGLSKKPSGTLKPLWS